MQHTDIRKNLYMDSIALMLLSNTINDLPDVLFASVMMGTPANKEILALGGFDGPQIGAASPNDLVVAYESESNDIHEAVHAAIDKAMDAKNGERHTAGLCTVSSWRQVGQMAANCGLCLISTPGLYAAAEAEKALESGMNVLLFSDNVLLEDERRLKNLAHTKGLLMMGPDCGTAILGGLPLAFANRVRPGRIGLVAASGTGLQEVMATIHRLGGGISNAIGTGGRDLQEAIGGITTLDALDALDRDEHTDVIVLLSKPAAPAVARRLAARLRHSKKPVVALFLGQPPHGDDGALHFAYTLDEAARRAVALCGLAIPDAPPPPQPQAIDPAPKLVGLYTGGTLASEAAMLVAQATGVPANKAENGCVYTSGNCEIFDLGDDHYTNGRPHPMMDPSIRRELMVRYQNEPRPLVLLMDVVLGNGASEDPAGALAAALNTLAAAREKAGLITSAVVNLLGTERDFQGLATQRQKLEAAGAVVAESNLAAVRLALELCGRALPSRPEPQAMPEADDIKQMPPTAWPKVDALLQGPPTVLNIGLRGFADELENEGASVVHFSWKPPAGGDRALVDALTFLDKAPLGGTPFKTVDDANAAVMERIQQSAPFLVDVIPASQACHKLAGRVLLHAGPPITWRAMTSPMQGSCIGAALFEGWAATEDEARALLERGDVTFIPCHHEGFVGPMGGITSGSMPVLKVENRAGGNYAYCTMNEGIGPVLRFGAYGPEVIERLRFMRESLGPILGKALRAMPGGLNVNVMIARAVAMGDEFHQRNIAASLVFLKEMTPAILDLDVPESEKRSVVQFLADTDQFFLNIMMATAKSVMDYAATTGHGTVVTAMTRNGESFGIRISGMGDEWFTASANTPDGLYFSGFSHQDANPDIGDSAITETFGVGGMAMIAAPAVTRFVGAGGFYDALETSNRMADICIGRNGQFPVPTWDFQGICMGIDCRLVAETSITPVINTGIAHKKAGVGQIGAGTVVPPLECFTKAVAAYAKKLGHRPG